MASHPFKPDGSKLPLFLTLGGMILLGLTTTILGLVFSSPPTHQEDESTEGMFLEAPPRAPAETPATAPGAPDAGPEAGLE